MAHLITELCIGCTVCAKKCPTEAIVGEAKTQHAIRAALCVDCGVCGNLCPKSAVLDCDGRVVEKMKLSQRPKARVDEVLCTGCEVCMAICREGCISIEPFSGDGNSGDGNSGDGQFFRVAVIDQKRCIGCALCETICIKEAVTLATSSQPAAIA